MAIATSLAIAGAAAAGLAGSAMQASAAGKAAKAQEKAADQSIQFQRDTATQARIDAYPWAMQGAQAMYMYMDELGIPRPQTPILPDLTAGPLGYNPTTTTTTPAPTPVAGPVQNINSGFSRSVQESGQPTATPTVAQPVTTTTNTPNENAIPSPANMPMTEALGFRETPGYQFQVDQGQQGVMNSLSALGMKNSGKALKSLEKFREGLASQEYGNWLNRLAGVAGMGQSQTNATNSLQQNAAQSIGQTYQDRGAATASGYVGQANAWGQGLGQVGNALGQLSAGNSYFPSTPGGLW